MEFKNCFVPSCNNDTENSPDKLFVQIRQDLRKQWCKAAKTEYFNLYTIYCCEDHFDPEKDLKNYTSYKKNKVAPVLKPTAKLRYISKSQPAVSTVKSKSASTTSKKKKVSIKSELEEPDLQPAVQEDQSLLTRRKRKRKTLRSSSTRPKRAKPAMDEFSNACRCCLVTVGTMKPLFGSSLDVMLTDLMGFQIKKNDGYPQQICTRCIQTLSSAHYFYRAVKKSHRTVEEKCGVTKTAETKASFADFPAEGTVTVACQTDVTSTSMEEVFILSPLTPRKRVKTKASSEDFEIKEVDDREIHAATTVACQTEEKYFQKLMLANVQLSRVEPDDSYEMPDEEYVNLSENECEDELPEKKYEVIAEKIETYEELPDSKDGHKCPQCLHVADNADDLKKHVATHVSDAAAGGEDTTPAQLCNICGQTFKCRTSLYKHLRFHSGHIFKCKYCDKEFAEQSTLKVHLISHSLTNPKPFDCELCERSFAQKGVLKKHLRSLHATKRPVVRCKQCPSTFLYKISLEKHCLRHHSPIRCNLCDSEFSGLKALEAHLKTHKQSKAFAYEEAEYLEFDEL